MVDLVVAGTAGAMLAVCWAMFGSCFGLKPGGFGLKTRYWWLEVYSI